MATQAMAYMRTSTRLQPTSVEVQMTTIKKECDARGWTICASECDENVSGVVPMDARRGLSRLHAQSAGRTLVVYSLDRLARDPVVGMEIFERFHAIGCYVVAIVEGIDTSKFYDKERIRTVFEHASWERSMISARVTDGMKTHAASGKMNPRPPYGYMWVAKNQALEPVEEEQKVIRYIRELQETSPTISCRAIARELNQHKEFPRRGLKEWSVVPVQHIMERHGIPSKRRVERKEEGTMWKPV